MSRTATRRAPVRRRLRLRAARFLALVAALLLLIGAGAGRPGILVAGLVLGAAAVALALRAR